MPQKTRKVTLDDGSEFDLNEDIDFGRSKPLRGQTRKQQSIAAPVQRAVVEMLSEGVERVIVVAKAVRGATVVEDEDAAVLPNALTKELRSISAMVGRLTKRFSVARATCKAHETDCPEGTTYNAETGECEKTPNGTGGVKSKSKKRSKTKPVNEEVAKSAIEMLDIVIADAEALRDSIEKMEVAEDGDDELPSIFGQNVVGLANQLGALAGRYPTAATKGFAVVEVEADENAISKAAEALTLNADARGELVDQIEKHLDGLTVLLRDVERMETVEIDDEDEHELPEFVGKAVAEAAEGLSEIADEYVQKDEGGDEDEDEDEDADAGADSDESEEDSDEDADAGSGEDGDDDADADADEGDAEEDEVAKAEKALAAAKKRAKAKKPPKTKKGKKAKAKKSAAGIDADALKGIVAEAVKPLSKKLDEVSSTVEDQGKRLNKVAKRTPPPNASEADGGEDAEAVRKAKVRKAANTVVPGLGMLSESEVEEQIKDDLYFGQ